MSVTSAAQTVADILPFLEHFFVLPLSNRAIYKTYNGIIIVHVTSVVAEFLPRKVSIVPKFFLEYVTFICKV